MGNTATTQIARDSYCSKQSPSQPVRLTVPVAVPGIFVAAEAASSSADRCHSLSSLYPPPAALASLPPLHKGARGRSYLYASGKLLREAYRNNTLDFFYDHSGYPYALTYNGTTYYYVTNLQGDVLAIVDGNKQVVATYTYDPYGKVLSATGTLAQINPLRYRGYYYDTETQLYYLQSRYYDPTTCRFLNGDVLLSTGQGILGYNMFAYCGNNPVIHHDSTGEFGITISIATLIFIGSIAAGAVCAGYTAYVEYNAGIKPVQIVGDSICAGISGFSIVYSGGMSLYQCYQNYCYLNGLTPATHISTTAGIQKQLQLCANTADAKIPGTGAVAGTNKHTAFAKEVNILQNSRLLTEVSYKDGNIVSHGTAGSIRFDVMLMNRYGEPVYAWDLKTGSAVLRQSRITQMQTKSGLNIPISPLYPTE